MIVFSNIWLVAIFAEVTDDECININININNKHLPDSDSDYIQFGAQQWPKYSKDCLLDFGENWHTLQRVLSATAELLVQQHAMRQLLAVSMIFSIFSYFDPTEKERDKMTGRYGQGWKRDVKSIGIEPCPFPLPFPFPFLPISFLHLSLSLCISSILCPGWLLPWDLAKIWGALWDLQPDWTEPRDKRLLCILSLK